MRLLFRALIMNLRKTCHRAVSPKITPYSCVLICCHYRYMIALHSTLSLICGIVTLKQDVNFMALDKFEEITLYCASFLVRFCLFLSLRFTANRNWLPRHIKEELLSTPSPSAIFKCIHWIFTGKVPHFLPPGPTKR